MIYAGFSYGSQTVSSGTLKVKKELDEPIEGDNVIIVEDIIDSGNTLSRLVPMLQERNPKSLKVCIFLISRKEEKSMLKLIITGLIFLINSLLDMVLIMTRIIEISHMSE